jgi:ribosomal protein L7/L12
MEELPPDAVLALQRGRVIEAIKIVRDRTGMDLKSAKEAVDRFADRQDAGDDDSDNGAGGRCVPAAARQDRGFASMPSTALEALAQGNKIEAIRLTREATGLSLAAAKRLVDNHDDPTLGGFGPLTQHMPRGLIDAPGRVHSAGYKWLPALTILLAAVLVWLLFGQKT